MGLKERLLALAAGDGNPTNPPEVTGKDVLNQSGNPSNPGNPEKGDGGHETAETGTAGGENRLTRPLLNEVTKVTKVTALKTKAESGNPNAEREVTGVTGHRVPATPVAPGDAGVEWTGEAEDVAPHAPEPDWRRPRPLPEASLVARLCAAGATVRTWSNGRGGQASIEAPAGIPTDLLREVEARGWRIIPGGKPNPEAEHDSWLAGVPIADLQR
jgi:hypothetical protein